MQINTFFKYQCLQKKKFQGCLVAANKYRGRYKFELLHSTYRVVVVVVVVLEV